MKLPRLAFTLTASLALCVADASALTAEELARFLGVTWWTKTVTLPESFVVEIHHIVDGAVGECLLEGDARWSKNPETGFTILAGLQNGKYRMAIAYGDGVTLTVESQIPAFQQTMSSGFSARIGEGDYVLFGEPKPGAAQSDDLRTYARGFLLRVKLVPPSAAEEARALRCLANAKQIALACRLFAQDNEGRFPTALDELVPDYISDSILFSSPLAPKSDEVGYELLGGQETDAPSQVLVRGRFATSDGRRSVVYVNGWGALEWR